MPTSKMYAEMSVQAAATGFGLANASADLDTHTLQAGKWAFYSGEIRSNGTGLASDTAASVGDIIQIAYDPDNNKAWIGLNNTWYSSSGATTGNPSTGANATFTINDDVFVMGHSYSDQDLTVNFGARPFVYTPPTGFKSLCTTNLPDPTIADESTAFDVKIYDGNGSTQTISGLNMSPDLVWLKSRSASDNHALFDTVRGAQIGLHTNLTDAEFNDSSTLTGFTSDGWTMAGHAVTNVNNQNYVGWAWDGGDLVTNSAYDQSEVWSSKLSTYQNSFGSEPVTNLFDGDTSTSFYSSSTSGSGIKFVPTTSITGSIELYLRNGDTVNSTFSYSLDNGTTFTNLTTTAGNGSYVSIGNQTISNTNGIIVRHVTTAGTNSVNWRAIKVDNKVLVDAGVTPVGSLNSSAYTQDATYAASSNFSGSTTNVNFNNMFNGITGDETVTGAITFSQYGNGLEMTWTAPSTITNITSLRLYVDLSGTATDGAFEVNGTSYRSLVQSTVGAGGDGWVTISESSLSTIKMGRNSNNTLAVGVGAVEVNGKILIDTNLTPPDVPSNAATTRANPTAGFSIVSVPSVGDTNTIRTAASGLNAEPEFIISKNRDFNDAWFVYHKDIQTNDKQRIYLNSSAGVNSSSSLIWQHTSSVIGFNGAQYVASGNTHDLIFYCWSGVENFSRFGSYVGTGSSPNFVYLGFRPAFVILKSTTANNWVIYDSTRNPFNVISDGIFPDQSSYEVDNLSNYGIDFLSNGFALRTTGGYTINSNNASEGHTYIYGAWAENPLKTARAR